MDSFADLRNRYQNFSVMLQWARQVFRYMLPGPVDAATECPAMKFPMSLVRRVLKTSATMKGIAAKGTHGAPKPRWLPALAFAGSRKTVLESAEGTGYQMVDS